MSLTWLEINKDNLLYNIQQFKKLAPHSELWPVVKSNAYGHGLPEIVTYLSDYNDIAGFMVANLEEALTVKNLTVKPIMVLSYFDLKDYDVLSKVSAQISLPVYDFDTIDYLSTLKQDFLLNVKVDTGTSRLGFSPDKLKSVIDKIEQTSNLKIFSIFTHYAESESADLSFSQKQLKIFQEVTKNYKRYKLHSACSAASISLPSSQSDIVRTGLGFYGLWPSLITKERANNIKVDLRPILSWKTKIIQLKKLKKGDSVGYNRTYVCPNDCQLAVLPIGYNEGYDRSLSNKAEVLISGQRCSVRGNICMNLTMVEIPSNLSVKVGEIVTLLGQDQDQSITAEELAEYCQTINYEIVTRINPNLKRIIC